MQIAMVGLGRMGANMVHRLLNGGHECVVYDRSDAAVASLARYGAKASTSLKDMAAKLRAPRAVWLILPVGVVDDTVKELRQHLKANDIIIDGGNSHYIDDIRRSKEVEGDGIKWIDVGTSGGVFGLNRGDCLMIGGDSEAVKYLDPIFKSLASGRRSVERTPGIESRCVKALEHGYLHCGQAGAGHFVKMVHNGIEYGLMAAYAESLNILKLANIRKMSEAFDADTAPIRTPKYYKYGFPLPKVAGVWRRGSVISSWLLDLTAAALVKSPGLDNFSDRVSNSDEGRWTNIAAIDEAVPVDVLSAALFSQFTSQEKAFFADRLASAIRFQCGSHEERGGKVSCE